MISLNIAICDDLQSDRTILNKYIEEYSLNNFLDFNLFNFSSGEELWESFQKYNYEIVFLDIYMGGKTGIQIAHAIRKLNQNCLIIFTTSSLEHAIESFEVQAVHYLVKPLAYDSVETALHRCKSLFTLADRYIEVISERIIVRILLRDLIFAEVFSNVITIHTTCEDVKTYMSMDDFSQILKGEEFLRCHRSYIVNMNFIEESENSEFILTNQIRIPLRRKDKLEIRQIYSDYLFNKIRRRNNGS